MNGAKKLQTKSIINYNKIIKNFYITYKYDMHMSYLYVIILVGGNYASK